MQQRIFVGFDVKSGEFRLSHPVIGVFLQGSVSVSSEGRLGHSSDHRYDREIVVCDEGKTVVKFAASPDSALPTWTMTFRVGEDGNILCLFVDLDGNASGEVEVRGDIFMGLEPYLGRLTGEENYGVFSLSFGRVSSTTAKTLFNRFNDSALTLPKSEIYYMPSEPNYRYRFVSRGETGTEVFVAKVVLDVIKSLGIRYYAPIDKSVFNHAPTGWCSWYYYYQAINDEEWEENVNWLAENLKEFGVEWVQIDDGWQLDNGSPQTSGGRDWRGPNEKFPKGMKWVADIVKQKGMKAGIWLIPQKTDSDEVFNSHPEKFLRKPDGTPVRIGDWHPKKVASYVVDPTNPDALEYLKSLFHTLAHDWGFDYFKIDNQPEFSRWYNEHSDARKDSSLDGSEVYRLTLKAIKEAVGPNKYLLGCYGIPLDGIGFMNGSRTGGDMEANWQGCQVIIRTITRWGFLNNVVWWCDPDTLCVREPLTLDEARIMATLISLSGQALMMSDKMSELPKERVEILKRVCPTVDIRPMEFYPWDESRLGRPKILDLKIAKHYGAWDVVAVFNWEDQPMEIFVEFSKLGLPVGDGISYHVFDFWGKRYEGTFTDGITVNLQIRTCKVFAIRKALGHPQVVSTSRHITQGIVDLLELVWDTNNDELHGTSQIVGGDPYRLYIHIPMGYSFAEFVTEGRENLSVSSQVDGELLIVELLSEKSQRVDWVVKFFKR